MAWFNAIIYFLYAIAIFIIYFLPGYLISKFHFFKFDKKECILFAFVFSSLLFAAIGLTVHIIGLIWSPILLVIVFFISILLFVYHKKNKTEIFELDKILLIIFLIQYLVFITIQIFIPLYPLGGDHFTYYDSAKVFLNKEWNITIDMRDRAPLYHFLIAFFMAIFGSDFWVAQIASTMMNSLVIIATFYLAEKFFNRKVAILSMLMITVSPLMIESITYVWPKSFLAFFILTFYYLLFTRKINFLFGLVSGLAFIAHPYSVAYIMPGILILFLKTPKKNFFPILTFILIPTILLYIPWALANFLQYGSFVASIPIKYYPFAVNGYEKLYEETQAQIWKEFIETPILYIIGIRFVNAFTFLFPLTFFIPKIISLFSPIQIKIHRLVDFSKQPWTYNYVQTLAGGLTFLLFYFTCIGFIKLLKDKKKRELLIIMILSFIFFTSYIGFIQPLGRMAYVPLVPLSMMIGFNEVLTRKNSKRWIKLIFILAIVECIVFAYFYSLNIDFTKNLAIKANDQRYWDIYTAYKFFRN